MYQPDNDGCFRKEKLIRMNTQTSVSIIQRSETELLNFLLRYGVTNDFPVAVWRLPNSNTRYLLIARQYRKLEDEATIEELPT